MTRDVLIVGSGAGGGAMALALARAGVDVLVLEKGPEHRREEYPADEVSSLWRGTFVPPLDEDPHVLVHEDLAAPRPTTLGWTASCVGGGTVHMGAFFGRFHPVDFRMRSTFGPHEAIADWPFGYDELEPYLTLAEREVGVSGAAGRNPFEGPRSAGYPMPPLDHHPLAEALDRACEGLGLHPFPTPRAINSRPYGGRPACSYCRRCASYGCRTGARGTAQEALLARAVATGRCEVRPLSMVREVTVDAAGRARGCRYLDRRGAEREVRARVVCVACSAVESARLLLMSRSAHFPDGLGNGEGQVGKNLHFHGTSIGRGRFLRSRHGAEPFADPNPFIGRSLMDHYFLPDGVSDLPKGGQIIFHYRHGNPILGAKITAQGNGEWTLWGRELKARLAAQRDFRSIGFEVQHDFLPNDRTFVELDPEVTDRWGLPVARIHLHTPGHHRRAGRWLVERGLEVLEAMGADEVEPVLVGETAPYLVHGSCRAGTDPASSVVDEVCRVHGVPNLFVVDGSIMPTSGGVPPTLTILANSLRVADRILAQGRAGAFGAG